MKEIHVNRSEKAALIAQIKAKADAASFVVVTDFKGMTVYSFIVLAIKKARPVFCCFFFWAPFDCKGRGD